MTTSVLDSSVAVKWLIPEPDSDKALNLRADLVSGAVDLIAPDFFPIEVTHALTRAERQGRVTPTQGLRLLVELMDSLPTLVSSTPLLSRAYDHSSKKRIGVYDCVYIALAERQQCELITADARLARAFQDLIPVVLLSSLS
jgi:predicted nucleic acid-binding protein